MWGLLKYKKRKFSKFFFKQISLESNKERKALGKRAKDLYHHIQNLGYNHKCLTFKNKLETIYDNTVNGIKVGIPCDWSEYGEKPSKCFLNLEKHRAIKI